MEKAWKRYTNVSEKLKVDGSSVALVPQAIQQPKHATSKHMESSFAVK